MSVRQVGGVSFRRKKLWQTAPLLLLLAALCATLAPSLRLGFVSDDYENLVEATYRLPLTVSSDGLHRPLRDIVFKVAYRIFGQQTVPYHLGIIVLHLLAVAALYRFVLECRADRWAAVTAAALYGFFPRNHQVLFWVSAAQDSVVVIGALIASLALLRFKETLKTGPLLVVLAAVTITLGFKETAITIFPLLFLLDLCCGARPLIFSWRPTFKLYLPLVLLGSLYLLWFKGYLFPGSVHQSFYGIQNTGQTLKMPVKDALNMLLSFAAPVEARQVIQSPMAMIALLVLLPFVTIGSYTCITPRKIFLAVGWVALALAPTAVLGFYTDRYLGLPFVGVALLFGFMAEGLMIRANRARPAKIVLFGLLCIYCGASVWRLTVYRHLWEDAAREVKATMELVRKSYPNAPNGSLFYFVDLTHTIADGQVYVFNGRLNGALWAFGYDHSITARRTFRLDDPKEHELVRKLAGCKDCPPAAQPPFIYLFDGPAKEAGSCAEKAIAASEREAPDMWR